MQNKSERILTYIKDRLPGSKLRISFRGVPHLVYKTYSVCYFCKNKLLKIWDGYATDKNHKIATFKEWPEVVRFFEKQESII